MALPRLAGLSRNFRGGERRGSASRKRSPGPAQRRGGSHRAKQGTGRSGVSSAQGAGPALRAPEALPDRPPLPLQAGEVRGARSPRRPPAPAAPGTRRPGGALAAEQGRAQELPQVGRRLSSAARAAAAAPAVGSGGAAARTAHLGAGTWAPTGAGRAGHLGASPARRRPAHPVLTLRKVQTEICRGRAGGGD